MEWLVVDDGFVFFNMFMFIYDIFYWYWNVIFEDIGCIGMIFSDIRLFSSGYDKINSIVIVVLRFLYYVFDNVYG